ncbi:MAG: hypothetical protein GY774_35850 [Planctomycetes bacterium]|nr:hypothetical protein [Planctomycetota bacterium]
MKSRNVTLTLILVMVVGIVLGAEMTTAGEGKNVADKDMAALAKVELPSKTTSEYWIIRTQTLTEFIPFLTQKRTEFRKISELISQFLVKTGKSQDFVRSGVKAPESAKLYREVLGIGERVAQVEVDLPDKMPTWEESVELAMRIIMTEGYLPTDVTDQEELLSIKRLCAQKEKYAQKVRKELHGLVQKSLNVWFYLETIDKQGAFREYAFLEKEKERKEKEEAVKEKQAQLREQRAGRVNVSKGMRRYDARYRRNRFTYGYGGNRW